ncbi:argininosuccinate lyase [Bathymodiolus thermophilus thioautotrophic gill symbiont]|uniref:Argininosuccinate lyase n=1 Tax=Bathymodiolus thermophilus thioautotrophic gill symbiont TaxID=2360 RepID=A0A8H8XDH5_9GAMM|nr:argininosuccinate lyase [Bathymodiolus thermophilus thioautotrophic gill symbiont]CAB5498503.1 Argininosuccinate lyase (EC [Bathymodiolus thermophilus thioautotrophic gill symbiont]
MTTTNQSWGGRFNQPTDEFVKIFGASVFFDKILAPYDIAGSIAHATMLCEVGLLTDEEKSQIIDGLNTILADIEADRFEWSIDLEDVHMNIEARLVNMIGNAGKKLHTGRSRNDQVATDIRLYLRNQVDDINNEIKRLQSALLDLAEQEVDTILPGFTHLQAAQPISFGHHMMAYFEMLSRDAERLIDCRKRLNSMPLGSAALAGTTYPINRTRTAELLGFERICNNSLDGVSDRDFAIEFLNAASIIMMHLSRFSEELILWSSAQFDFIELPDSFCTGSSIMPQKKNPDVPELVRGKTGRVYGHLTSLLTIMKSQPLAYNKDNQEDKEPLFDTVNTLKACLRVFADMVPTIETKRNNMYNAAKKGYTTATDLADYLVKKGLPFRDAHEVVGKSVAYGIQKQKDLSELSLKELQAFNADIENDVFDILSLEGSLNARNHLGGTAPNQVKQAINNARKALK